MVPFQMSVFPKNGILSSERFWSGLSEVVPFQMSVSAKNGILSDERTHPEMLGDRKLYQTDCVCYSDWDHSRLGVTLIDRTTSKSKG